MPKEKEWGRSLRPVPFLFVGPEGPHTCGSCRHWAARCFTMLQVAAVPKPPRPTLSTPWGMWVEDWVVANLKPCGICQGLPLRGSCRRRRLRERNLPGYIGACLTHRRSELSPSVAASPCHLPPRGRPWQNLIRCTFSRPFVGRGILDAPHATTLRIAPVGADVPIGPSPLHNSTISVTMEQTRSVCV